MSRALLYILFFLMPVGVFAESAEDKREDFMLGSFKPDKEQNKQPIFVTSQSLRVETKRRLFSYTGNVEVRQGDLHVTGEFMTGFLQSAK